MRAPSARPFSRRRALALAVGSVVAGATACARNRSTPETEGSPSRSPGPSGPALRRGEVLDARALGAVGDGVTDDGPALRRALARANAVQGTLYLPAATYYVRSAPPLAPTTGVTLAGDPGRTRVRVDAAAPGASTEFCRPDGPGITLDGLTVERGGDFPAVLFPVGSTRGLTLSRMTLVGNSVVDSDNYCHGLQLGTADGASISGLRIVGCLFDSLTYGLFQTNTSTARVTDIAATDTVFRGGTNTDLEFNGPSGAITGVRVERCTFTDNASPGFGVGFALVEGAAVRDCTFTNYSIEGVHVEDYSSDVVIERNVFTACGLAMHSHVQVVSGASNVRVIGNTFRAGMNTTAISCVNALPGGVGVTGSGRPISAPSAVTVADNDFECSPVVSAVYLAEVAGGVITGNRISGPGASPVNGVTGPSRVFTLLGDGTRVEANVIGGRAY